MTRTRALPEMATVLASHAALPALWASCAPAVMLAYVNPIYSFSVGYGLSVAFAATFTYHAFAASGAGPMGMSRAAHRWSVCVRRTIGGVFVLSQRDVG